MNWLWILGGTIVWGIAMLGLLYRIEKLEAEVRQLTTRVISINWQ